ncbi:MAG: T9SS type A sorting domain-containing protein [Saprospiraceae bacterium]|nr:T9SS type A sorting domain-containing protein [Saprospiraceae bacterium]
MKKLALLLFSLLAPCLLLIAQHRYLDQVFNEVAVTEDLLYGQNATILYYNVLNDAVPQPLYLDLYEPVDDAETGRPLAILLHDGYLLQPQTVDGCIGSKRDATVVEMATRLARMGYVVAAADYRIGWQPISPNLDLRLFTLVNAIYRGTQDARTCVRFFQRSVAEAGNPHRIHPNKIAVIGLGGGGYLTYLAATLDTITDTYIPKLVSPQYGPMLRDDISGNVDATSYGVVPVGDPGPFAALDTLCYPNHIGYSGDFQLGMAIGGALLDTSFIEGDDTPLIGMYFPSNSLVPCKTGILGLLAPPPFLPFNLEVSGPCEVLPIYNSLGGNDIIDHPFTDPVSIQSGSYGGIVPGFFPFLAEVPDSNFSPWNYASSTNPYNVFDANCDTNSVRGKLYLDTILQYFAPRACLALGLGCNLTGYSATSESLGLKELELSIYPNPATTILRFNTSPESPMRSIHFHDLQGRLVRAYDQVGVSQFTVHLNGLVAGSYLVKIAGEKGVAAKLVELR